MRERDQRNSSRYSSSNNTNSNSTIPMPPVIPAEGMTMKKSKMPNGEYVWTIHTDKGDSDRSNRSSRDNSSRNNADANLVFEDENLINYGDFCLHYHQG